ncbi:ribosomal protein S8 [Gorgonomyces haynaldii]|nr:ribosomal protein S8 [Gorgonomyces haynaldii]
MAPVHHLCSYLENATKYGYSRIQVPYSNTNKSILHILYQEGLVSRVSTGDKKGPFELGFQVPVTLFNRADARLWVDLKYRHGESVLKQMRTISKPSRRIYASANELRAIASAKEASSLLKAQKVGQITIVKTPIGIVEMKEAIQKSVGGEVLCMAA